jgi:hypothetical protein
MFALKGSGGRDERAVKRGKRRRSNGPFNLNFPELFFHQLSEGSRGRFAVEYFFGVRMVGVGEDCTIVGRKEVKSL